MQRLQETTSSTNLQLADLNRYIVETCNYLLTRMARDVDKDPPIAGWHNFFKPNRIGTTGSAMPLIFLDAQRIRLPHKDEVINKLRTSQFPHGGWAILSLGEQSTVEGTAWPMRALALVGGRQTRDAVHLAEEWLLSQQMDGGWGSTRLNQPRTFITVSAMESLSVLSSRPSDHISCAVDWLARSQRKDWSWGPTLGEDGTVVHTAMAIRALVAAGLSPSDARIVHALSFLRDRWIPDADAFYSERYEVNQTLDKYARVTVDHDSNAIVIQTLLSLHPDWAFARILPAVQSMVAPFVLSGTLNPAGTEPSIWNIIPRAEAFSAVLKHLPAAENGRAMYFNGVTICTADPNLATPVDVARIALKQRVSRYLSATTLLLVGSIVITLAICGLYFKREITGKEVLLSLGAEFAVWSAGAWLERKYLRDG